MDGRRGDGDGTRNRTATSQELWDTLERWNLESNGKDAKGGTGNLPGDIHGTTVPDFAPKVQNRERAMAAFASVPSPNDAKACPGYQWDNERTSTSTYTNTMWSGSGLWAPPTPLPTTTNHHHHSSSSNNNNNNNNKAGSTSSKKEREGKGNTNQRERGHRQNHERGRRGAGEGQLRAEPVRLTQQLHELVRGLLPTKEETERKARTVYFLQMMVGNVWKQAKIDIFGSAANSFGVRGSDIDISVDLPIEEDDREAKVKVIETLGDMLQQVGMEKVVVLAHARVPLVKYVDPRTGCASDICVNNRVAVANTKMLCDYARIDSRLRQLAFVVKHWAKARKVNETYRGTLSSYAYVLMCIHLLQRRNPPILPCLQGMRPTFSKLLQKGQDIVKCEYFDEVDKLARYGDNNRESVAELLFSFFEYWAWRHDYAHSVVSIRTGGFLSKAEKGWTKRIGNERHLICIEDPFETGHDLGRVVDRNSISALRDEFVRAAKILRDEEDPLPKLFEPYIRPDEQDLGEG